MISLKVVAFNGSARKNGNTALLIKRVLIVLEEEGFETELVQLAGAQIRGCTACRTCFNTKNKRCVIEDDKVNEYIQKMLEADGIILGSPVYFSMMTPEMKALIDRTGFVARANSDMFRRKSRRSRRCCQKSRRNPDFRCNKSFLPYKPNDYSSLVILEHRNRQEKRRRAK